MDKLEHRHQPGRGAPPRRVADEDLMSGRDESHMFARVPEDRDGSRPSVRAVLRSRAGRAPRTSVARNTLGRVRLHRNATRAFPPRSSTREPRAGSLASTIRWDGPDSTSSEPASLTRRAGECVPDRKKARAHILIRGRLSGCSTRFRRSITLPSHDEETATDSDVSLGPYHSKELLRPWSGGRYPIHSLLSDDIHRPRCRAPHRSGI